MKKIKGFIFGKAISHKPDYLFHKIRLSATPKTRINFAKRLVEGPLQQNEACVLFANDLTLCFTENIDAERIKYLSVIARCMIFEIDLVQGRQEYTIFHNGEVLGTRKEALTFVKKTRGLFSFLGKGNEENDYKATAYQVFETISQGLKTSISIARLLDKTPLVVYQTATPTMIYHDPFSSSSNATPFAGNDEKIKLLMPSVNGLPMPYDTDFDGSPMTEENYARRVKEGIRLGVVSPAILWQHDPLCVSVYSSDLDAVLIFNFKADSPVAQQFKHYPRRAKMVSVNTYLSTAASGFTDGVELDIIEGPNSSKNWKSFVPHILNFIIDDDDAPLLNYWANKFTDEDWNKIMRLTREYFEKYPGEFRVGFFMCYAFPRQRFLEKYHPECLDDEA